MLWLWRWGLPPPLVLFGKDPHFLFTGPPNPEKEVLGEAW